MNTSAKERKIFSGTLMKQDIKSNRMLAIVILIIMIMMCVVINFAMSMMTTDVGDEDLTDAQTEFYSYLYVLASYNELAGTSLSYEDFSESDDLSMYETVFSLYNQQADMDLSTEGFATAADTLSTGSVSLDTYVRQFEYVYALGNVKGCFSGESLDMEDMMTTMLEAMGMSSTLLSSMESMDMTSMLNRMYFTVMGLLPIFLFVVIAANSLVVDQVDRGSMAYVLSTPTRRSAVTITQAIFLIVTPFIMLAVVCAAKIGSTYVIFGSVNAKSFVALYLGMYLLVEAVCGICYLGSCVFNLSKYALAFGGGLTVWFFLASLLGMFGTQDMVDIGIGVEALGLFNKLTLVGLFDVNALSTVGTSSVDTAFVPKLVILAVIAAACYVVGAIRFQKKDLPL